jgi:hypothetical protein
MTHSSQADPPPPARITEASYEPADMQVSEPRPAGRATHTLRPMSFSGRMFNVGWKGWVRLALICIAVGAVFQAGGFNPLAPDFTIGAGLGQIVNGVINIAGWAAQVSAMPLLLGALVVLPLWAGWRAIVTALNRDRPPGPGDRILPEDWKGKR